MKLKQRSFLGKIAQIPKVFVGHYRISGDMKISVLLTWIFIKTVWSLK